jgi:hypothetical protein
MLAWVGRYAGRANGVGTPTIAQMFSARVAATQLAVMVSGVALLVAGIASGAVIVAYAGAAFFLVAVLLFISQITRVALGGRVGGIT